MIEIIGLDDQVTGLLRVYVEYPHESQITDQLYAQMMGWA